MYEMGPRSTAKWSANTTVCPSEVVTVFRAWVGEGKATNVKSLIKFLAVFLKIMRNKRPLKFDPERSVTPYFFPPTVFVSVHHLKQGSIANQRNIIFCCSHDESEPTKSQLYFRLAALGRFFVFACSCTGLKTGFKWSPELTPFEQYFKDTKHIYRLNRRC